MLPASLGVQKSQGFIWACDFGELYFKEEVFDNVLNELDPATSKGGKIGKVKGHKKRQIPEPTSNLAFSFADMGFSACKGYPSKLIKSWKRNQLIPLKGGMLLFWSTCDCCILLGRANYDIDRRWWTQDEDVTMYWLLKRSICAYDHINLKIFTWMA